MGDSKRLLELEKLVTRLLERVEHGRVELLHKDSKLKKYEDYYAQRKKKEKQKKMVQEELALPSSSSSSAAPSHPPLSPASAATSPSSNPSSKLPSSRGSGAGRGGVGGSSHIPTTVINHSGGAHSRSTARAKAPGTMTLQSQRINYANHQRK